MNENHSHPAPRGISLLVLGALLALACQPAGAVLHAEHSLRYLGWMGLKPVTVEITLRARPRDMFEYREWIAPRWWAGFFGEPEMHETMLRAEDSDFRPVIHTSWSGEAVDLQTLPDEVVDLLLVRLEARADIASGVRQADYAVWQDDGTIETWRLEVTGDETVETPDARYRALTFELGNKDHSIRGWSAPLLAFHFVRLEFWEGQDRVGVLELAEKELWE
ncbi:MAG: hypothetical protein P8080_02905 [Gammaproteobacteria bacterium]